MANKHAVIGLTENAAIEYGSKEIRVAAICPGAIKTEMIKDILETIDPSVLGPLGRPTDPGEIADLIVYLASDQATYMNGSIVTINGGLWL